jgi:tryptophan synthase alpha chain
MLRKGQFQGVKHIEQAFSLASNIRSAALMPYYTLGYPDQDTSLSVIKSIAPFSDLLELGIPFSDPIADGPTIQRSTQLALDNGTSVATCLQLLRRLRSDEVTTPVLLMGYFNPILTYGQEAFVRDSADAGADGFIIPDLPPEEAQQLERYAADYDLSLVYFIAPNSSPQRISRILSNAKGFIYMVSIAGVTGARGHINKDLANFVVQLKSKTDVPIAVGFGISTPDQARMVGDFSDGVIVGSALLDTVNSSSNKTKAAVHFVKSLYEVLADPVQINDKFAG